MQIVRTEEGSFTISEIEPPLVEILMSIPLAAEPGENGAVTRRFYPDPIVGPDAESLAEEWLEYVKPELKQRFEGASALVDDDLKQLRNADAETQETLTIAPERIDAWLNTLNQARLGLAARYDITEEDMERPVSHLLEEPRDFALFQIHFYGFLQECLIRGLESEEGGF